MRLVNSIINVDPSVRQIPVKEDFLTASSTLAEVAGESDSFNTYSTDPYENDNIRSTIDVSVDLLQRLYSGLYILQHTLSTAYIGDVERSVIAKEVIQTKLINPLTNRFPDMADFDFNVSFNDNGNMIVTGNNFFTSTLLNAIAQSLISPVEDRTALPYDPENLE